MKKQFQQINSYYEGLIQNLYGGAKGCFVSFMQFFYQYNQAKIFNETFAPCFKELYLLELENCEILSELLLNVGGDNKFYSCSRKFLSGFSVDYVKNLQRIYLADIELLEISLVEVKSIIEKVDNVKIKNSLKRILQNKKASLKNIKEKYFKNSIID